jgi:hypothetical protein
MSIEFTTALQQGVWCGVDIPTLNNVAGATEMAWVKFKNLPDPAVVKGEIVSLSIGPPPGLSAHSRCEIECNNDPASGVFATYAFFTRSLDGDADSVNLMPNNSTQLNFAQHVAATIDYNTRQVHLYLNGVLNTVALAPNVTPGNTDATNSKTLSMGVDDDLESEFSDAFIEDVRIYDRVLSANEIMSIFESQGVDGIVFGLRNRYEFQAGFDGQNVSAISPQDSATLQINASVATTSSPVYRGSIGPTFRRRLP